MAKATFSLTAGESPLASQQEPVHAFDLYEGGVLWAPSDLAPYKVRPDVVLVGSAFAPRPTASLVARLVVGSLEKSLEVHAGRWMDEAGRITEGPPFTTMPLGWERAAGGADTANPVGMSLEGGDAHGRMALPHLVAPGVGVPGPGDYLEPVAFAPLAPSWPGRAHLAGSAGPTKVASRWFDAPLASDVHPAFFNVAPTDQQPEYLADDPRLILEHLSPAASRVSTQLASVRLAIYLEGGRAPGRYGMRPDTLWIDTDRQICCVTYRATVPLAELDTSVLATILSDPPNPLPEPTAVTLLGYEEGVVQEVTSAEDDEDAPATPPRERLSTSTSMFSTESGSYPGASWGERESPAPSPPTIPPAATPDLAEGLPFRNRKPAHTRPIDPASRKVATPFENQPPLAPPLAPPLVPPPPPMRAPELTTPPPVVHPRAAPPPLPPPPVARPSSPDGTPSTPPKPATSQPGHAGPAPTAAAAWFQQPPEPPRRVEHEARAALDGVAGASNAAARPPMDGERVNRVRRGGSVERPRVTSNDVVDLVWFDEALPVRIRRHEPWTDAVRDEVRLNDWITAEEATDKEKDDQRRFVTRALGRVPTTDSSSLHRLLAESIDEEGFVERPLVITAGELALQFDPIEVLKSSIEIASQLGSSDKLKEALDASKDIAKAQRVSTPLVDNLLSRIRQAFTQANRSLPNDYLESTVQRTMLEERKYLRRQVLGEPHLLALLSTGGGPPTPTYLPEHLASKIPVLAKFKARLVAEPHPAQHPGDGEGATLRVLALGRVIGSRARAGG